MHLTDWALIRTPYVHATGHVYGNSKFPEGVSVDTSEVMEVLVKEDVLSINTRNSVYDCSYAEMAKNTYYREQTENILKELVSAEDFERFRSACEKQQEYVQQQNLSLP